MDKDKVADLAIEQIRSKAREFHGLAQLAKAESAKQLQKAEFYEVEGYALERVADHIESYIEPESDK